MYKICCFFVPSLHSIINLNFFFSKKISDFVKTEVNPFLLSYFKVNYEKVMILLLRF